MPFKFRLIPAAAALCLLASCGGGSTGTENNPPIPKASSGWAVDGYLSGATVSCDATGITVSTTAAGLFTFPNGCSSGVTVSGGTSVDSGVAFTGVLKAPAGSTIASPLTTLLIEGLTQVQLKLALGVPNATDLQTTDPALKVAGVLQNSDLLKKTLAVQQLVQKLTELFAGLGGAGADITVKQAVYGEVAGGMATLLKGGGVLIAGTTLDQAMIGNLVKAAAARVGAAAGVAASVKAALAAINGDALAQVIAPSLKAQAEAMLKSTDANLMALTTSEQADQQITNFVVANKALLGVAPNADSADLSATLTNAVNGVAAVAATYLTLAQDSVSLVNGAASTSYSMAQFQSDAGISVSWPLPSTMMLNLKLSPVGAFTLPAGQTVTAAVAITETGTGKGEMQAYIDNVSLKQTAAGLEIKMEGSQSMVYGVSSDGTKKAVVDFTSNFSAPARFFNTLTTAGATNSVIAGSVVNYAINNLSNDFTNMNALRGKYKVTIVVTDLPLRKLDGSKLPALSVTVPTALNATGGVSSNKTISGRGLTGYITLTN